jgi:hypothetical protein
VAEEELFELTLHGGAPERRYRRLRPDIETIDWAHFSPSGYPQDEIVAARRAWTAAALQEYAGAASHSLLLRALVRARAPLDLSAVASRFILDELAHSEICSRIAVALGGGTPLSFDRERVFPPSAPAGYPPEREAAELVIQNCVSECWSHELLHQIWQSEPDPVLREARGRIARDEAGHGGFGWLFLDWLAPGLEVSERAHLRTCAGRLIETLRLNLRQTAELPQASFNRLTPMGLGREAYFAAAEGSLEKRVISPLRERDLA